MSTSITVTDQTFEKEVLQNDKPVLVDFWASWCPPCVAIAPHVEDIAEEFAGKVDVAKLSVEENQIIPSKYDIRSIPTLLVFQNGEVKETIIGFNSKAALAAKLNALLTSNA